MVRQKMIFRQSGLCAQNEADSGVNITNQYRAGMDLVQYHQVHHGATSTSNSYITILAPTVLTIF